MPPSASHTFYLFAFPSSHVHKDIYEAILNNTGLFSRLFHISPYSDRRSFTEQVNSCLPSTPMFARVKCRQTDNEDINNVHADSENDNDAAAAGGRNEMTVRIVVESFRSWGAFTVNVYNVQAFDQNPGSGLICSMEIQSLRWEQYARVCNLIGVVDFRGETILHLGVIELIEEKDGGDIEVETDDYDTEEEEEKEKEQEEEDDEDDEDDDDESTEDVMY